MKEKSLALLLLVLCLPLSRIQAGGISVDAGLTPAQNRWILRMQYRYMEMHNSEMTTKSHMVPFVVAYGVTPKFTLMTRAMYVHKTNSMDQASQGGINDIYLLSKFNLYRINTPGYVFGIAPHVASNIPVGTVGISNRTWNPEVGINISYRPRFWAVDFSSSYTFSDMTGRSETDHNDIFELNTAISVFFPFKNNTSNVLAPVLEFNYTQSPKILFISPGISFIHSSLVLEGLIQIPVYQKTDNHLMNQKAKLILGIRYMF
jgi:hypothetical protein